MNIEKNEISDSKIGICGFNNIGNTCYMNSILQLLIHSKLIINFLLAKSNPYNEQEENNENNIGEYYTYLKQNIIDKMGEKKRTIMKLSDDDIINIDKEEFDNELEKYSQKSITVKLAEIINIIIYKGNSSITPKNFKFSIDKRLPNLRGFNQQDSHELLNGILDIIIEETGNDSDPTINNVPDLIKLYLEYLQTIKMRLNSTSLIEEKKTIINDFNEYKKQNKEIIDKYSGLKYMTNVFKKKRKNSYDTSTTGYNPMIFNLLTFNIDKFKCVNCDNESFKYEYNTIISLPVKSTLDESFQDFIQEELIDRRCEICKYEKSIKKKLLWRPGMTIFIQLCRFNNNRGNICKNNTKVDIPLLIDLTNYCDNTLKTDNSLKYKLRGISNHIGSLNGGHYTADCLSFIDDKTWYHFDDSSVGKHKTCNFDTSSAYILLYEIE